MDYYAIFETICEEFGIELVEIPDQSTELYAEAGALYISEDWIEDADDGDNFYEIAKTICECALYGTDSNGVASVIVSLSLCRRFEVTISESKKEEIESEYPDNSISFDGVLYEEPEYRKLEEIIAEYGVPVDVVFPHFFGDFFFRAESIDTYNCKVKGMYYKDGEPYRRNTASLQSLCKLWDDSSEEDDDLDEDDEDYDDVTEEEIDYRDFFVYADDIHCGHDCKRVIATVQCYSDGEIKNVSFEAFYCEQCGVYYFPERQYKRFLNNSEHLLCQVLSYSEYRKYMDEMKYGNLNPKSVLGALGYSVSQKEKLSVNERRTILQYAIDGEILTKERAIEYLKFFIRLNERNHGQRNAIQRWQNDLDWLKRVEKSEERHVGVRRIVYD